MKTVRKIFLLGGFLLVVVFPRVVSAQGAAIDCRVVAESVRLTIEKAPDHTLTAVEDALVAAPGCVCEIVKAAITASQADGPLVQKIVYTAVKTTQQHAPIIAECAVAAAPQHADFVRAAFAEAFEDQPRTTGKSKKPTRVATAPQTPTTTQSRPTPKPTTQPRPTRPVASGDRPAGRSTPVYQSPERVVARTASGKEVVEIGPGYAYDPKGIVVEPEPAIDLDEGDDSFGSEVPFAYPPLINFFGGPPLDMTGLYLMPPVASAPPFFGEDRDDPRGRVRSVSISRRSPPRSPSSRKPRRPIPPIISRPISPTGP